MCPTALGRKEKKLYNVHIVQWSGERTLLDDKVPSTQGGNEAYNHHFRM